MWLASLCCPMLPSFVWVSPPRELLYVKLQLIFSSLKQKISFFLILHTNPTHEIHNAPNAQPPICHANTIPILETTLQIHALQTSKTTTCTTTLLAPHRTLSILYRSISINISSNTSKIETTRTSRASAASTARIRNDLYVQALLNPVNASSIKARVSLRICTYYMSRVQESTRYFGSFECGLMNGYLIQWREANGR